MYEWGFPGGSDGKESACNAEDLGSIPGSGRSPGEGNGNPLQYSYLENHMNRGVFWATGHGVAKLDMTEWLPHCPIHGCESWTIKNAEHWRIDTFELCWKTLESPLGSKEIKSVNPKGNHSWIFIGRTDAEAETSNLDLMWSANSLEKSLMLGKTEGRRRRGSQKMRWLDGITMQWVWTWAKFRRWWGIWRPGVLQSMGLQRVGHDWATEQQFQA